MSRAQLGQQFRNTRAVTERLAQPLSAEDQGLQSMPACSPTKWHRAHTTWFFETFLLEPRGIPPYDARWRELFNSYYVAAGPRHPRPERGLLSRPSVGEIGAYRRHVDARVSELIERADDPAFESLRATLELGVAHEQQHQELLLSDILHAFWQNPLSPSYRAASSAAAPRRSAVGALGFRTFDGGVVEIGAAASSSFRFDNEEPRHRVFLEPFEIADRLLTVGEWREFARAGGYDEPRLWLSEGWDWARRSDVRAPLYVRGESDAVLTFGLDGPRELLDDEPVAHVSYYEADALARFFGARLPTEAEWEVAAAGETADGNFLDGDALRVVPAGSGAGLRQLHGDAWEWTQSAYAPYPGFRPRDGAIGEYNGKFMVNQLVLRGGSCFTPRGHVRPSYRNFWHPDTRFQVTGVRLARASG